MRKSFPSSSGINKICFYLLLSGLSIATSSSLWGGEVVQVTPIAFGSIELNPAGDTVTINARNGVSTPVSSRSVVTEGRSGKITVTSTVPEQVTITYPQNVTLRAGSKTITISDIPTYSEYSSGFVDLPGSNIQVEIDIGGKLSLNGDETTTAFSGTMTVELTFNIL